MNSISTAIPRTLRVKLPTDLRERVLRIHRLLLELLGASAVTPGTGMNDRRGQPKLVGEHVVTAPHGFAARVWVSESAFLTYAPRQGCAFATLRPSFRSDPE